MLILALDTCDSRGNVAIMREDIPLHTLVHDTQEDYSSWLLPAVNEVLRLAAVSPPDVDLYSVAAGPGSFTALRVALTATKAWAELYQRPIAPVSRLAAIAEYASGSAPYLAAFFDARRNQIFAALYRRCQYGLEPVVEDAVIPPEQFVNQVIEIAGDNAIDWASLDPQCLLDAPACLAILQSRSEMVQCVSPVLAPVIGRIAHRLAAQNRLTDAISLDANYIRRSDAEIFWKSGPRHP